MKNFAQKILSAGGRAKTWRIFVMLLVITIIATLINVGGSYNKGVDWLSQKTGNKVTLPHVKEVPFRLGLDLLGGTQLTYQADVSAIPAKDRPAAVEGVRDVIERRVNVFGVAEPNIQTNFSGGNYYVLVELAGIKDTEQAIRMIGETPLLEFKEQNTSKRELTKEEEAQIKKANEAAEKKAKEVLEKVKKGEDFAKLADQYSQDALNSTETGKKGGDLGWITEEANPELYAVAKKLGQGKTSTELAKISTGYEMVKVEEKRIKTDPFNNKPQVEVKASHLLICFKEVEGCESGLTKESAKAKIEKLKTEANPGSFVNLVKTNSTEPGSRETAGDLGWFGAGKMVKPFEEAVFAAKKGDIIGPIETQFGFHLIYKQDERQIDEYHIRHILVKTMSAADVIGEQSEWKNTELTGKNLTRAIVTLNQNDYSPEVSLEFDEEGGKLFGEITERNIGKQVAIFLDGYAISSPTVNEKIPNGKAVITGKFNEKDAKLLSQRLNAGALPVPIELANQQTIGASLGQQAVTDSLKAGLIGFILVALFMIIFYRLPGLLAVLALAVYTSLVLAIFKLWPVTLTLSGLAGFIMSIGVAVDANILIFARMREELNNGKSLSTAIEEGFRRAWPSIRDSNLTTLLTCFILAVISTSVVKGFAITLALGVLVSMFTAIFVTRTFLKLLPEKWLSRFSWLMGHSKKN